jgi:DNA-binding NtrC family response regulator
LIRAGSFREDLYYRLNLIELHLPPLAQRPADILPLAVYFLGDVKTLSDAALAVLQQHTWPGNVRELKNTMQRAALLATGPHIGANELGLAPSTPNLLRTDAEPDRAMIEASLARAQGVVARAAADLGLSRQALYRRMERLGLARMAGS